ncbi:MAG: Recombination protein RecR [Microgenomates group bacterium GW2011_GWA1_48_10]|uniref:Recombination protein RecR n=1 Tax=Candidatus Gottesmanbacteria bacterium RIFCSPHIGHO2_01_FULL_47_48 TaxID=1798381 RepID=A0A1F6A2R8_9BACT|nr:MAG: Recombination protein RecR [Microgenomates group bacterium GW2011_GWA1_48_10]OGG18950.1 MAG: recombination protein RecR [Candidatus Gottesmanbacteria bacterium RIFCSPHIGHO2_01_FULL_47_48]
MNFPRQIQNLIEAFERLPGVGPKTAERLTFYLLHVPDTEIKKFGEAVAGLKSGIVLCRICKNVSETEVCAICGDSKRDQSTICVVENPLDVFSLEKTGKFGGVYHVLHGVINPLENIGPEELYIQDLIKRLEVRGERLEIKEVILALNPTMEGEATAMFLTKQIRNEQSPMSNKEKFTITRLGVGMPMGGDVQYADETTLGRALEGRRTYE